jgi:hypothetical protein|nr:MAG TPA: hypothetical protein [Caudoviricetes sp.]
MNKIKYENAPSTKTPLSAELLNLMQQNIEDEINKKANKEYVDNNKATKVEVESIKNNVESIKNNYVKKGVLSVYSNNSQTINAKDPNGRKVVSNSIKKDIGGIAILQADGSLKFKRNCTISISYNLFVDCISGYVRAYLYTYRGTQLTTLSDTLFNATSSFKSLNVAGVIHDFQKDDTLFIDISQSEGNPLTVRGRYENNNLTLIEI